MNNLLLSYRWKIAGILLLSIGVFLAITYFWFDFRFKIPVFAVYSVFLETKTFEVIRTNFSDELILLFLLAGLGLVVFSKEKNETQDLDVFRMKAFARAWIANVVFLILSVLFIYGSGFMTILIVNLLFFPVFYLLFFYTQKRVDKEI